MDKKLIKKYLTGFMMVLLLVLLDQFTKYLACTKLADGPVVLIPGVFEFRYITNNGAAWGMLGGQQTFFIILTSVMLLVMLYIYVKTPVTKRYYPVLITDVLLFSGAVGNFIDRLVNNYVHDFLYFSLIDFPVFNVADCYITVSAVLIFVLVLFYYKDDDFEFLKLGRKK